MPSETEFYYSFRIPCGKSGRTGAKLAVIPKAIEDIVSLVLIELPKTRGKYKTKKQQKGQNKLLFLLP